MFLWICWTTQLINSKKVTITYGGLKKSCIIINFSFLMLSSRENYVLITRKREKNIKVHGLVELP